MKFAGSLSRWEVIIITQLAVYTTYIPLIYIYIANWVIICYLPPIKGTRKQPLTKHSARHRSDRPVSWIIWSIFSPSRNRLMLRTPNWMVVLLKAVMKIGKTGEKRVGDCWVRIKFCDFFAKSYCKSLKEIVNWFSNRAVFEYVSCHVLGMYAYMIHFFVAKKDRRSLLNYPVDACGLKVNHDTDTQYSNCSIGII